jgi:molybdenum cofactor cytidylyltransferase
MGRPKLLLPWGDTTVIGHLLAQWHTLDVAQTVVVMRPDDSELAAELDRLKFPQQDRVINSHPERGMFSSIVCAANWTRWRPGLLRWAIALGDQPHLKIETLQQLLNFSALNLDAISQPAFEGRTAHPVILPRAVFEGLKTSPVATLKDFLNLAPGRSVQYVINDPGLTLDLDTPEDYIKAKGFVKPYEKNGA